MPRSQDDRRRAQGVPINPRVHILVDRMRQDDPIDADASQRGFRGWHERGYMPHRDKPGLVQFVTFCLADGLPRSMTDAERAVLEESGVDALLDQGLGGAHLREAPMADCVESALIHFHTSRYALRAWCVMPNHVHVLLETMNSPVSRLVESWKKHTASRINRMLARRGRFWQSDYWDTYMRDAAHERETMRYIERNPVKAGLVGRDRDWPWSSARRRDEYGRLVM